MTMKPKKYTLLSQGLLNSLVHVERLAFEGRIELLPGLGAAPLRKAAVGV